MTATWMTMSAGSHAHSFPQAVYMNYVQFLRHMQSKACFVAVAWYPLQGQGAAEHADVGGISSRAAKSAVKLKGKNIRQCLSTSLHQSTSATKLHAPTERSSS